MIIMTKVQMNIESKICTFVQELQSDIEHHSAGVGSVLNLCEVLLHDTDACPTQMEFSALQDAMKNLDKRWRHICQLSPDRRARYAHYLHFKC